MRILLVSATLFEIRPVIAKLNRAGATGGAVTCYQFRDSFIDVLIPGLGMMQTAYHLGRQLATTRYDVAINGGIGGSFRDDLALGDVVHVIEECIPEMGADDGDGFTSMFDLGLMDPDSPPYEKGRLVNVSPIKSDTLARLRTVKGSTANTIHDNLTTFRKTISKYQPETESMEGAAFLYSCLSSQIQCAQIRSISNYVAERDKTRWNVELAFKNLNKVLWEILDEICT